MDHIAANNNFNLGLTHLRVKQGIMQKIISCLWRGSVAAFAFALSGCAVPLFAGITLNEVSTAGSAISTLASGKGLGDHALDLATGYDCRVLEGSLSKDRHICEKPGSPRTASDFQGISELASARPAANRPSLQQHSMGPIASTLADRNADRPVKERTMQVAAARPTPASIPRPIPATAALPSAVPMAPGAVSIAAMPASYGAAVPGATAPAILPQYY